MTVDSQYTGSALPSAVGPAVPEKLPSETASQQIPAAATPQPFPPNVQQGPGAVAADPTTAYGEAADAREQKRRQQQEEWQRELAAQADEARNRKRDEGRRRAEEDKREEERLRRDLALEERRDAVRSESREKLHNAMKSGGGAERRRELRQTRERLRESDSETGRTHEAMRESRATLRKTRERLRETRAMAGGDEPLRESGEGMRKTRERLRESRSHRPRRPRTTGHDAETPKPRRSTTQSPIPVSAVAAEFMEPHDLAAYNAALNIAANTSTDTAGTWWRSGSPDGAPALPSNCGRPGLTFGMQGFMEQQMHMASEMQRQVEELRRQRDEAREQVLRVREEAINDRAQALTDLQNSLLEQVTGVGRQPPPSHKRVCPIPHPSSAVQGKANASKRGLPAAFRRGSANFDLDEGSDIGASPASAVPLPVATCTLASASAASQAAAADHWEQSMACESKFVPLGCSVSVGIEAQHQSAALVMSMGGGSLDGTSRLKAPSFGASMDLAVEPALPPSLDHLGDSCSLAASSRQIVGENMLDAAHDNSADGAASLASHPCPVLPTCSPSAQLASKSPQALVADDGPNLTIGAVGALPAVQEEETPHDASEASFVAIEGELSGAVEATMGGVNAAAAEVPEPAGGCQTAAQLPTATVTFEAEDGEHRTVVFRTRPLGLAYKQLPGAPVSKVDLGGHADQLGVRPGWKFVSLAGRPIAGMGFATFMEELRQFLDPLPAKAEEPRDAARGASAAGGDAAVAGDEPAPSGATPPAERAAPLGVLGPGASGPGIAVKLGESRASEFRSALLQADGLDPELRDGLYELLSSPSTVGRPRGEAGSGLEGGLDRPRSECYSRRPPLVPGVTQPQQAAETVEVSTASSLTLTPPSALISGHSLPATLQNPALQPPGASLPVAGRVSEQRRARSASATTKAADSLSAERPRFGQISEERLVRNAMSVDRSAFSSPGAETSSVVGEPAGRRRISQERRARSALAAAELHRECPAGAATVEIKAAAADRNDILSRLLQSHSLLDLRPSSVPDVPEVPSSVLVR